MAKVLDRPGGVESHQEPKAGTRSPFYKGSAALAVVVLLVVALVFGIRYYLYARSHESTDDAFIEGRIIQISPKVAGHVLKVYVSDNQRMKPGDLLVELDRRDFETRLAQAQATLQEEISKHRTAGTNVELTRANTSAVMQETLSGLQRAKAELQAAEAEVAAARSRLEQVSAAVLTARANWEQARALQAAAQAEAVRANADLQRYQELYERDEVSRQQLDQVTTVARMSAAQLEAAHARVAAAEAQVAEARATEQWSNANLRQMESQRSGAQAKVGEASGRLAAANTATQQVAVSKFEAETIAADIEQARAAMAQAELELSYTRIYAPEAGRVTRKIVVAGAFVQVGQALMAIVPADLWVVANFKETQLRELRVGQPVKIRVDAYPDRPFKGRIDSIQTGTGARFSMLPPENATGNYVKVVQRVPVKILFDEPPDSAHVLGPGMSVVPEVKVK
ncbi:MAG: HlyD family secretion protein [Acidobacteria bacterium]|nr:HlyD family secretion protein [Acidobacteriota bacterium]